MMKQFVAGLLLITGLSFVVNGYAAVEPNEVTTVDGEHFRVSYKSKIEPLPLNRIHSWVLHVITLDGKPVEKAMISVYGGMPAHRHGLPTQPKVTEMADGDYLVEGIKFSMTGMWEMWFNIQVDGVADKTRFVINF
jgi:hypothetical protein